MAATLNLSSHEVHGLCKSYFLKTNIHPAPIAGGKPYDLQVLSYKFDAISDDPSGFLGNHSFLSVNVLIKDAAGVERVKKLEFFIKSTPHDIASRMAYIEEFGVFKKEVLVFRDVLPKLQRIFVNFAPICYEVDNNLLVFENLTMQGFRMAAGQDGLLNYEHLHCVLKTLAAMHASSIIYEERQGQRFDEMHEEVVRENAYPLNVSPQHVRRQNFNNAVRVMGAIIRILPKYQSHLQHILQMVPQKMEIIFEKAKTSTKYKNVFSHGDLWANNIMFKYGKSSEIPTQCRLVDFQLARYAPPILDVITVLTISTMRSFRESYLDKLLHEYYLFLKAFLSRENVYIETCLPLQQFDESIREFRIAGLIESILFSHLTVLPGELTRSLTGSTDGFSDFFGDKRIELCMRAFQTDCVYRERLTDMIEDFVDNFIL